MAAISAVSLILGVDCLAVRYVRRAFVGDQGKRRIRPAVPGRTVTATGTLGSIAAAAARVPAPTALATAATARKRRRVGSRGGNIIGWSIADVFVGGVIYTLLAWVIGFASFVARVRAGAEVSASPRLAILVNLFDGQVN
jgi:hypothetical protein